jgi:hypothetical protein
MIYISSFISCDFDKYCKSYEGLKVFFMSYRQGRQHKNYFKYVFYKITKISATLDRSLSTRKALIHSIPISKVKDMKRDVLQALKRCFTSTQEMFYKHSRDVLQALKRCFTSTQEMFYELNFNN